MWYLVYRCFFWSLLEDDENLRGRNARPSSKKGMEMRWQQTRTDLKGWIGWWWGQCSRESGGLARGASAGVTVRHGMADV